MSILPGGSLARSLWTAPSLKASRRRIYIPGVLGADAVAAFSVCRDPQIQAADFDPAALPVDALAVHLLSALLVHAVLYALLSIGRRSAFNPRREREQVEAGEITIDEAARRFSLWPQKRLTAAGGSRPVTVNASGFPVIGAAFVTGPSFRLKHLGADSYRWTNPLTSMRGDGQMRAVINPRSRTEWVLPFPSLGAHAIPEGYIGRSVEMIAAAEAMRRFQEERRANGIRSVVKPGGSSFREGPAPEFSYSPYTGTVPGHILDVLSDIMAVRSEVSGMHILWSAAPGAAPRLTVLVEAHHDRTTVAQDITRALGTVAGGDRLDVRLMDPRETLAVRELGTVAVS